MNATTITTGKVRLSYPHLFVPATPMSGSGDPKYSTAVIIPKSDKATLTKIKDAINVAKEEGKTSKWGGKVPAKLWNPLRDGDEEKPDDPAFANCYFFNCSSKRRPGVVDRNLEEIIDPEEVYGGCYARVNVTFYSFDAAGNRGVGVGLNHVQKLADGERLGGASVSVNDAFSEDLDDDDDIDLDI